MRVPTLRANAQGPMAPHSSEFAGNAAVILLVFAVALGVRLFQLDAESIWLDEAYSLQMADPRLSVKEVVWNTGADFHPPLYYLILHFVLKVETTVFALRLPSAVFGALAAAATATLGCIAGGRAVGLLAGLLFALAPFQVFYGQEARMYSPLAFATTTALAAFTWLANEPGRLLASPAQIRKRPDRLSIVVAWLVIAMAIAAAMLAQNLGVLLPGVLSIAVLALWLRHGQGRPASLIPFALTGLLALALWLPWLPFLLRQLGRVSAGYWITPPSLQGMQSDLLKMTFGPPGLTLSLLAGVAALFLLIRAGAFARDKRATLALLLLFAFGPLALALGISQWRPVYLDRALLWIAAPLFVAIAVATGSLRSTRLRAAIAVFFLAVTGWHLVPYFTTQTKPGWAPLVAHLRANVKPGDAIVIHRASAALPFRYHASLADRHGRVDLPALIEITTPADDVAAALPPTARRVWLIYSFEYQDDKERTIRRRLSKLGEEVDRLDFGGLADYGKATLYLFSLKNGASN